ncbi:MAG: hypothetical protein IRZ14_17335, partial [Chloroflexi bacterium]|nr:hypothetical protein [Chloroflexota bacterium]
WGVALASTLAVGGVAALAVGLVVARGAAPSNIVSAPVQPTGVGSPTPATAPTAQVAPPAGTSGSQGAGFVTVEGAVQLPFGTAVLGEKDWRGDVYVVAVEPRTGARFESRVATEEGAGWDYRLKLPPGTYQLSIEPEVAFRTPTGDRQVFRLHCTALIEPRGVEILDLVLQPAAPGGAASGEAMPPCEPSALSEASDGQQGAVELVPRAAGPTVGP